jgi:AcrR family transcriptional regulator
MGRPVRADPKATRQRILSAATRLFAQRGPHEVSIRDVARGAGLTLGTVHHHYGTKERLYQSVIDAVYAELEAIKSELATSLDRAGPTIADLADTAARTCFRFACEHRAALRLLMRTVIDPKITATPIPRKAGVPAFLDISSVVLARGLGDRPGRRRIQLQSIVHLIVRYALTEPEQLAEIAGLEDPATRSDPARALTMVEDHLAEVARLLLLAER